MDQKFKHGEAFRHMTYQGKGRAGIIQLSIWNSRDGVTPFMTVSKEYGIQLQHINWQNDRLDPDYKPKKGDLIWVSYTEETAKAAAEESYEFHKSILDSFKNYTDAQLKAKHGYNVREHLQDFLSDKAQYIKEAVHQMVAAHGEPQPKLELVEEDWK